MRPTIERTINARQNGGQERDNSPSHGTRGPLPTGLQELQFQQEARGGPQNKQEDGGEKGPSGQDKFQIQGTPQKVINIGIRRGTSRKGLGTVQQQGGIGRGGGHDGGHGQEKGQQCHGMVEPQDDPFDPIVPTGGLGLSGRSDEGKECRHGRAGNQHGWHSHASKKINRWLNQGRCGRSMLFQGSCRRRHGCTFGR